MREIGLTMEVAFWFSISVLSYVYIGYFAILMWWREKSGATTADENWSPSLTLLIPAYNEEKVIRDKLQNSLALDYPKDLLEIVVVADGCTDRTTEIVRSLASDRVTLKEVHPRSGKAAAINRAFPETNGEIVVFSDANTLYQRDALRKLVRHFSDPQIGGVSGDVQLVDAATTHAESEGLYYRYERRLQELESSVGSIIGADGGMYAIRREAFRAPSDGLILDDFVVSMNAAILGYRVIYDPEAVAVEAGTKSTKEEFRRKVRIISGGIQALKRGEGVPGLAQPALLFGYLSHKVLRWFCPYVLIVAFVTSGSLLNETLYRALFVLQCLLYGIAGIGAFAGQAFLFNRLTAVPYYFCVVNSAAFFGTLKGIFLTQQGVWERTGR